MSSHVKKTSYRLRVYQLNDADQTVQLVFGNDPGPDDAKLLADNDVVESVISTPHVENPAV